MCNYPVTIKRPGSKDRERLKKAGTFSERVEVKERMKREGFRFDKNGDLIGGFSASNPRLNRYYGNEYQVPCGKCMDCLRRRQNDFAIRVYREACKYPTMHFLTLTYRPGMVPLASSLHVVDTDTGETHVVVNHEVTHVIQNRRDYFPDSDDLPFLDAMRVAHLQEVIEHSDKQEFNPTTISSYLPAVEGKQFVVNYTFSLCRRDVRLWLKNCRVSYLREFKKPLPDFKYLIVGEYGKYGRPHYHCIFLGLSLSQVEYLSRPWAEKYGYTYLESPRLVDNKDGNNSYLAIAKYLGKYAQKGNFDANTCRMKYCEKGRVMASKAFGTDPDPVLVNYHRCYDIFGKYDPDGLSLWSEDKLTDLANRICDRLFYSLPNKDNTKEFRYALPQILRTKLFKTKIKGKYENTQLSLLVSSSLRDRFLERDRKALEGFLATRKDTSLAENLSAFYYFAEVKRQDSERDIAKYLREKYSTSKL